MTKDQTCKVASFATSRDPADRQNRVARYAVKWSAPELYPDIGTISWRKSGDSGLGSVKDDPSVQFPAPDMAPSYTHETDIWAMGVVLYEIFSYADAVPYGKWPDRKVIEEVTLGYRLPAPRDCPREIYRCVCVCVCVCLYLVTPSWSLS